MARTRSRDRSIGRAGILAAVVAATTLVGCATRTVPDRFPAGSPASLETPEVEPAPVGRALVEDPPLPGESVAGWHGLEGQGSSGVVPASASRPTPALLTADEAVRIALKNNREIRAVRAEVGVAEGLASQAGALPNPRLEVEGTPALEGRLEVAVEMPVTASLLAPMRRGAALAEADAARRRAEAAEMKLAWQVRAAFYATQAAEQKLALAHQALDARAAGRDATEALYQAGNVVELDAASREASYEFARLRAGGAELELLEAREKLGRLLGLSGEAMGFVVDASLPEPPATLDLGDGAETRALSASLELAELRSRMDASARTAQTARIAGWVPDLAVRGFGEKEGGEWGFGGGVELTLPIFDRRGGSVAAAESSFDAGLARYEALAGEIRSSVRRARSRLLLAHASAQHWKKVVLPARARLMGQMLLQYNAMQVSVFELLQARRDQLDGELGYVDALRGYWTEAAAYEAALAGARLDSIETNVVSSAGGGGGAEERGH